MASLGIPEESKKQVSRPCPARSTTTVSNWVHFPTKRLFVEQLNVKTPIKWMYLRAFITLHVTFLKATVIHKSRPHFAKEMRISFINKLESEPQYGSSILHLF